MLQTVKLIVYDIMGRKISVLYDNVQLNKGTYEHLYNASGFASGIYFYSLYVDNTLISTQKMIFLK